MNRIELADTFRELASEIAEKDFSHVSESNTIAELGIDSLGVLELVGSLEREFHIRIPDEDLVGVETVSQLLDLVQSRAEVPVHAAVAVGA